MNEGLILSLLCSLVSLDSVNEKGFLLAVFPEVKFEAFEENENGLALASIFFSFLSVLGLSLNTSLDRAPENLNSGPLISISPVSYTHLDVYKRQENSLHLSF